MRRLMMFAVIVGGCASVPDMDNPLPVRSAARVVEVENPILIAPGIHTEESYAEAYMLVLRVVDDYFEIAYANPFDGRVVGKPKIAPGIEQPWKPGTGNLRERIVATFQTIRYRCTAQITPIEGGGYFVDVAVFKELLDDPRPSSTTGAISSFREQGTVERQFEVIDENSTAYDGGRWIPKDREHSIEQAILRKIREGQ